MPTWHQESLNICLIMSRELSVFVPLMMPHSHQIDPVLRLKVDVEKLVTEFEFKFTLAISEVVPKRKFRNSPFPLSAG